MQRGWWAAAMLTAVIAMPAAAGKPQRPKAAPMTRIDYRLLPAVDDEDDRRWMLPAIGETFQAAPVEQRIWRIRGTKVKLRVPI